MKQLLPLLMLTAAITNLNAQNVGIGTTTPAASAQLDVSSTSKGFLMPRMNTAQRNSIAAPALGLTIYNLDDNCTDSWNGTQWIKNCGASQTVDTLPAQWTQKTSFGGNIRLRASGFSIGNKGYLGLGVNPPAYYQDLWEFDPIENTWTQKANFPGAARHVAVGFSIGNKGYFGTGQDASNNFLNDFWEYDPVSNQWTQKQDFGGSARFGAIGFGIGNKGYLGTGDDGLNYLKDFWEYDPGNNQWTQKLDFGGVARSRATGFAIGSKGFIGTGVGNINFVDFWEYNPANNQWTQKQNFGGAGRNAATGFAIADKGYIGSGFIGGNYLMDFWEYDTTTNQWTQRPNIGGPGRSAAVGFSIGQRGYIGTGNSAGTPQSDFWEYNLYPLKASFSPSPAVVNALQYNDGSWTRKADSLFTSSGQTRVGIGTSSPAAKLDVVGTIKTTGLQLVTGASNGFVLKSDANGIASWANASSLTITETDPQVGDNTTNFLSKWDGTQLVSSTVVENTGNVGIGITPARRLDVSGTGGLRVSSTNPGTGTADWIAGNFGGTADDRVVMGNLNSTATLGAHNNALNAWANLAINPGGGNVGIGLANPLNKLDVGGGIAIGFNYAGIITAPLNGAIIQGNLGIGLPNPLNRLDVEGGVAIGSNYAGSNGAPLNGAIIEGRLGVGLPNPATQLDVFGTFKLGKSGSELNNISKSTVAFAPRVFAANASAGSTYAVAGAGVGGSVMVSPSAPLPSGLVIAFAAVSSNGNVDVVFCNTTGAGINYVGGINLYITVVN